MYPDELFRVQFADYKATPEISRQQIIYKAFCWWSQQDVTPDTVQKLLDLRNYSNLDDDTVTLVTKELTQRFFDFSISKGAFAKLLEYPDEWLSWGMYPDELFQLQLGHYELGSEAASEHYRYGAFWWWLRQSLTPEIIEKYQKLTQLDPDTLMGEAARQDLVRKELTQRCFDFSISKEAFAKLMNYPDEWLSWEMYPDELFQLQLGYYELGSEKSSEDYRYRAFYWWLYQSLTPEIIEKYQKLTQLDPDTLTGESARQNLEKFLEKNR